uniref:Uncharacterized protein n=1 Tax=Heterorhabditis bacteriophora TaxID=37862 RepID=A0A1I7W9F7_HETBA
MRLIRSSQKHLNLVYDDQREFYFPHKYIDIIILCCRHYSVEIKKLMMQSDDASSTTHISSRYDTAGDLVNGRCLCSCAASPKDHLPALSSFGLPITTSNTITSSVGSNQNKVAKENNKLRMLTSLTHQVLPMSAMPTRFSLYKLINVFAFKYTKCLSIFLI